MRVAVVSYLYDPGQLPEGLPAAARTGRSPYAGIFVRDQAAALAAAGIEVELLTPASYLFSLKEPLKVWREYRRLGIAEVPGPVRERFAFWPCRAWLTAPPGDFWAVRLQARALGRLLDAGPRPDLIHAHFGFPTACFVRLAARKRGIPYIVTVQDSYFEEVARRPFAGRMLRRALAEARQVLCLSNPLRERILRHCPELGGRVVVVPNCFNPERFRPPEVGAAQARGQSQPRLLAVGSLIGRKRHDLLLRAAAALRPELPDISVTIAGSGGHEGELRALADGLGLADRVAWRGNVDTAALMREGYDVFILASDNETFGVVVIEALASGIPVVATRCGGPEDILTDQVGRLVKPGDLAGLVAAIREVWERRADFPPERLAGYARERYAREVIAGQLRELYNAALKGA